MKNISGIAYLSTAGISRSEKGRNSSSPSSSSIIDELSKRDLRFLGQLYYPESRAIYNIVFFFTIYREKKTVGRERGARSFLSTVPSLFHREKSGNSIHRRFRAVFFFYEQQHSVYMNFSRFTRTRTKCQIGWRRGEGGDVSSTSRFGSVLREGLLDCSRAGGEGKGKK